MEKYDEVDWCEAPPRVFVRVEARPRLNPRAPLEVAQRATSHTRGGVSPKEEAAREAG